jgi:hypothetical protein
MYFFSNSILTTPSETVLKVAVTKLLLYELLNNAQIVKREENFADNIRSLLNFSIWFILRANYWYNLSLTNIQRHSSVFQVNSANSWA